MILAVKNDDVAALLEIFGPAGKDFVSTEDDVQDKNSRAAFAALAQEKMRVNRDNPHNPSRATLLVGNEDWPVPVPLVKQAGSGISIHRLAALRFLTVHRAPTNWTPLPSAAASWKPRRTTRRRSTTIPE